MGGVLAQLAAAGAFDAQADSADDGDTDVAYLWPECVPAWGHWLGVQTQWRTGMAGREGLDYSGVRAYLDEHMPPRGKKRREMFACMQACEAACLDFWAHAREVERGASGAHPQ